uniref:Uncharacterized protein n=1 Tax=Anguilla anguilla TaxID=7936 RepID=A0A0E9RC74_ANGAN
MYRVQQFLYMGPIISGNRNVWDKWLQRGF